MPIDRQAGVWDTRRADKARRIARAAPLASDKVIPTEKATEALEALLESRDKVILEGDNQKQADFLSRSLAAVDPGRVHDLHLLRAGPTSRTPAPSSSRVAPLLAEGKMQVGAIHTYIEPSGRLFVDLLRVALVAAADAADRDGNLYTGTPTAYAWVACLSTNWHSA